MKTGRFFAAAVVGWAILSSISFSATYGGGTGSTDDPYQIWTPQQMNTIGSDPNDWDNCFKLMADIDMSIYTGTQYKIIGNSTTKFTGTFDGNHHRINNLTYTSSGAVTYIGVFGGAYNATIKDLDVENISFSTTGTICGGLVGYLEGCSVTNCYTVGTVNLSNTTAACYAGGLVGWQRNGTITDCSSATAVTAFSASASSYAGGLLVYNFMVPSNAATVRARQTHPLLLPHQVLMPGDWWAIRSMDQLLIVTAQARQAVLAWDLPRVLMPGD